MRTITRVFLVAAVLAPAVASAATPDKSKQNTVVFHAATAYPEVATSAISSSAEGIWNFTGGFLRWRKANGQDVGLMRQEGSIPSARVAFSVNPTTNDTLGIGSKTFTFKTSLGAATTTTQIKIGASAAVTLASLLSGINGVTDATVVADTTPFALVVVGDAVTATVLRVRKAASQGGIAVPGTIASTALTASVSGGASAWSAANLNASGKTATDLQCTVDAFTVTAAMITNASWQQELPFVPGVVGSVYVRSSSGVLRAYNEAVTISGNALNFAFAGGASPNAQATDVIGFSVCQ